ncbi:hypothetical protein BGZ95_004017, partial [Linnemannia exigua]
AAGTTAPNIQATDLYDYSFSALTSSAFARHSQTLQMINFLPLSNSRARHFRPFYCSAELEVLKAHDDYSINNNPLIKEAVVTEWACTRMRHLEIAVEFTPDGRDPEYLADPTKMSWKEQDHEHWGMLDTFYTQIGKLENLEVLNIKSVMTYSLHDEENDDEGILYMATCLPGLWHWRMKRLVKLDFCRGGRGLTKLRDLSGSFLVTTQDVAARKGEREAEWFITHLPALRRATLLNLSYALCR